MSKNKNFEIKRTTVGNNTCPVSFLKTGDVFERQGGLHMVVNQCSERIGLREHNTTVICNLNTGSVWPIASDEVVNTVENCVMSYEVIQS